MKFTSYLLLSIMILSTLGVKTLSAQNNEQVIKETYKYQRLMALIDAFYVEKADVHKLTEKAIIKVLAELDPHSTYISKEDVQDMSEPLEGGFFGIGIQFNILRDTLMVVTPVPGGPSEKLGLKAGDRIVTIDGENVAAVNLKNSQVRKKLKGRKGSRVNLQVKRVGEQGLIDFSIIRDKIPLYSIDASYMVDKKIGYIRLSRFAATTVEEFEKALTDLKKQGMQDLIFDLTGNTGGYLGAAITLSDHFLDQNKLIVYTDGIESMRSKSYAYNKGLFEKGRLVIMVNENSASASEIVSGAVQDWDRAVIVGHRSFGKGLVQRQFPMTDTSMVRLTIAHYFTPSGRCIQKPYDKGQRDYRMDVFKRYASGELVNKDSIKVADSLKYETMRLKREVYGGGGIIPDVFVPIDTTMNYSYYNRLAAKNIIYPWVVDFIDKNRDILSKKYPNFKKFDKKFIVTNDMLDEITKIGEKEGVEKDEKSYPMMIPQIKRQMKAYIARDLWELNETFKILNKNNLIYLRAVDILKKKEYEEILK